MVDLHSMQPMPAVRQPCGQPTAERFGRGEKFVPVVDGADVGIAGVGAALAGGVGDHDFGFGADVGVGFGERDGVAVGLGHFAAIEAGDAGSFGEEDVGLVQNAHE